MSSKNKPTVLRKTAPTLNYVAEMIVPPITLNPESRERIAKGEHIMVAVAVRTQHKPGMLLPIAQVLLTPHADATKAKDNPGDNVILFGGEPLHPDELEFARQQAEARKANKSPTE